MSKLAKITLAFHYSFSCKVGLEYPSPGSVWIRCFVLSKSTFHSQISSNFFTLQKAIFTTNFYFIFFSLENTFHNYFKPNNIRFCAPIKDYLLGSIFCVFCPMLRLHLAKRFKLISCMFWLDLWDWGLERCWFKSTGSVDLRWH